MQERQAPDRWSDRTERRRVAHLCALCTRPFRAYPEARWCSVYCRVRGNRLRKRQAELAVGQHKETAAQSQ